jgi:hypothetical protein
MRTVTVTGRPEIEVGEDGRVLSDEEGNHSGGRTQHVLPTSPEGPLRIPWRPSGESAGRRPELSPEETYTFEIQIPEDNPDSPRILSIVRGRTRIYDADRE